MTKIGQSIIMLEEHLYRAKKLIIKKDCTLDDLAQAAEILNKCRSLADAKENRIDIWFGKLELKRSKITRDELNKQVSLSNAKNSFLVSLSKTPTPSAFHGLYKVSMAEHDWQGAVTYLEKFESSDRKHRFNYTLVHRILDACMGVENDYPKVVSGYIFSNKANHKHLLNNYRLAEEAFIQGKYNACLKHLLICSKLAMIKSISIDFSSLISSVQYLVDKKNLETIAKIKRQIMETKNSGEKIMLIRKVLSYNATDVDFYFLLMDSYIELGVYSCIPDIIDEMSNLKLSELDQRRVEYYRFLATEQTRFTHNMIYTVKTINAGDEEAQSGEIAKAFNIYTSGLKSSGNSVFLSKIGDLFYQNGYYEKAAEYYLEYLKEGYENKYKVYINLYKTYRRLNQTDKAVSIACEAFLSLFLVAKGYTQETWLLELANSYESELGSQEMEEQQDKKEYVIGSYFPGNS